LIVIFFNKMAFSNLILGRGDTFLYFYPYWQMAAEALRDGRVPLWNPYLFMGAPFLANSQAGFFYPFNWPVWLLLPAPYAVSASILLHLFIAGCGAYWAGRRCLSLGRSGALVTAVLFTLGGYLTAQVEHVNQLQGLAWLPWFFIVLNHVAAQPGRLAIGQGVLALAVLFTLQLLAGHSQTTFITGIGLIIWTGAQLATHYASRGIPEALGFSFYNARLRRRGWFVLLASGGIALMVTAVQLLPTLELAQLSSRQGGLPANEVLSFSLHPLLLTRALLPAYGQSLFSEYIAFVPLTALMLAFVAAWQWRQWRGILPALVLALIGLLLALGLFNPLYWLLARLPGFNLFRVPARWLVLYAFGLSLLAGAGWQIVLDRWLVFSREWAEVPERAREKLWLVERPLAIALLVILGLILWNFMARFLAIFMATGPEAPFEVANTWTGLLWLGELVLAYLWLSGQRPARDPLARWGLGFKQGRPGSPAILALLALVLLFAATRTHPYNNLTTPEAFFDLRPSITRLQAGADGRLLSLSDIFFDPGDQAEIDTIYADQLAEAARYDYTVAIKQKEIIAPNLPMIYELASVDGFDGGILPIDSYSHLIRLVLPDDVVTTDGRLREHLTAVPAPRWLDLFSARYLITDKVGDTWRDGVFFDMQHPVMLDDQVRVGYVPDYEATELWLIAGSQPGDIIIETAGHPAWHLTPQLQDTNLYRTTFPEPATPKTIALSPPLPRSSAPPLLHALSLVDSRDQTFHSLVPGNYRLIHSGDVKIYENLDVLPRATLVSNWQWQPDIATSVAAMQAEDFVVGETAVLIGNNQPDPLLTGERGSAPGTATITQDETERIVIQADSAADGLLVLSDAYYPGWQATVDGEVTAVYPANAYFRAVFVPAGQHEVVFTFVPESVANGRFISLLGLGIWGGLSIFLAVGNRSGLLFSRRRPTS
jgi:hypothetical protein